MKSNIVIQKEFDFSLHGRLRAENLIFAQVGEYLFVSIGQRPASLAR
jgi:hypothetical protein